MSEVPHVVLRSSRLQLYMSLFWIAQGVTSLTVSEPQGRFDLVIGLAFLALGALWFAMHAMSNITVTESLVIVRRGLLQDIYETQTFIDGDIEDHRGWPKGYTLNGELLRLPFLIRPGLIVESIMQIKGLQPERRKESPLHGRQRSLF